MNGVIETIAKLEAAGAALRLDGDEVRIRYREAQQREQLAHEIGFLRAHRDEVADLLRTRATVPVMPPGVRLLAWNLKQAPVAIETCGVVTDPALFALTTLGQLRVALAEPGRWIGWTVPQLIDRLHQVGVDVVLELNGEPRLAPG